MKKPYIICHMMTAVDGRIDCGMTVKIPGSDEYYKTLSALDVPTTVSGRVTALLEMAEGEYTAKDSTPVGQDGFSKKQEAKGYEVVADSTGTLRWPDNAGAKKPLVILTSQRVSKEYLAYLDDQHISWIVAGVDRIDLAAASEVLYREFGVERMAIVGGGTINGGFLGAGLLDEVSILLGPGIDGRKGMTAVFDGLPMDREPTQLKFISVTPYDNGAIWLRYQVLV